MTSKDKNFIVKSLLTMDICEGILLASDIKDGTFHIDTGKAILTFTNVPAVSRDYRVDVVSTLGSPATYCFHIKRKKTKGLLEALEKEILKISLATGERRVL